MTAFAAMAGAAETAKKKPKKAKKVSISGKLGDPAVTIDEPSSISMTVIVKRGGPQKLKNVSVTFSYECADQPPRTGVATYTFPEPIDVEFEPGSSPDRVDFEYEAGGYTGIFGDVTRKGSRAFGQVFVGLENDFCANKLSDFTASR